jgi:hypothetical protein
MDSPFLIDGKGNVMMGGLVIDRNTGIVTFADKQTFPGSGTVTSVSAGTGLTGGPITTSGTISIADGGVTTAQIGSGAATSGQVLTANSSGGASWQTLNSMLTNSWSLGGNGGMSCTTSPCTNFLGTSDNASLEMRVNNQRAFRIESATSSLYGFAPNVLGGFSANSIVGAGSTIVGGGANGIANTVFAEFGTVGGGFDNHANGALATVAGGGRNTASGVGSMVPGGYGNTASGDVSFAAGYLADTNGHKGAFVWADESGISLTASADEQFLARASGGVIFYSTPGLSTGVQLAAGGGSWSSVSDRNVKDRFAGVDAEALLAQVVSLPITTWNYKTSDAAIRHIGPMAQDFFAVFKVGEDDRHMTEIDEDGVALAAIQGLNQKLEQELKQKEKEIQLLKSRLETLEAARATAPQGKR